MAIYFNSSKRIFTIQTNTQPISSRRMPMDFFCIFTMAPKWRMRWTIF